MSEAGEATPRIPLNSRERRVLGVLIEKQKTTPEYYPLSIAALVTGCNQKSNRDPVTNYDADTVEDVLNGLRQKGVAVMVEGGGRVVRWKHQAYDWLGLRGRPAELAVLAELLLRGPQTEGELRPRAGRMDEIADLSALQNLLATLTDMGLVTTLSPPGQKRGVVVAHTLYKPEELDQLKAQHAAGRPAGASESVAAADDRRPGPSWSEEAERLHAELDEVRATVKALQDEIRALRSALGES